jgi:hypothetical protein
MKRFVEGEDRRQGALLPHCLDDYVTENNPVRIIEAFIDELDLDTGFRRCPPYYGVKTAELLGFRRGCPVLSILRHILLPIFVTRVVPVLTMWLAF